MIRQIFSIISFISSVIIAFIAVYIPPVGIIDESILWFTAQLLLFSSTMLGINLNLPKKSTIFK